MNDERMKVAQIRPNPDNPRFITEEKFEALVQSLTTAPWMLDARPLVVDEDNVVLGGNMRLKALKHLGVTEVPVKRIEGLSDQQKREFVIKDNIPFGQWDYDALANAWDADLLNEWGMDVWADADLDGLFDVEPPQDDNPIDTYKITLEYGKAEYDEVVEALKAKGGTFENAVYQALTA